MWKKIFSIALFIIAVLLLYLAVYMLQQKFNRERENARPAHYSCVVVEDADSPVFYAYLSYKDRFINYFNNLEKTLEKTDSFSENWLLRITFTDSISGIGTDSISIPDNARTKIILVGTSQVKIDQITYQIPLDLDVDIIAWFRNWNARADEGTYLSFNFKGDKIE